MFRSISSFIERIGSFVEGRPFFCGFLAGVAVVIAFLLFIFLLYLAFRPRKLRRIVIPAEGGVLTIDAKAVQGAVRAVADGFPAFDVRKVALFGKPSAVELLIAVDFNGGATLSDLSMQFRAAVARMMTDTLGMEKPARIELEILRSGADVQVEETASSASSSEPDQSASEPGQSC